MNFPFGPGGPRQLPPGFPPGYPMFRMPPPDLNNPQGGHNMPFMPGFPMLFEPQSEQWFPAPRFPGMQQPPESHRYSPGNQHGPPSPYNGQQSTEVKSKRGRHNDGEGSRIVADPDLEYEKIQAKRNREQQSINYEVIDDVLKKEHTLSKQLLHVKRYQECLDRPEGEVAERVLRLPKDIVLETVDAQKLKFLKHSNANRMGIEKQLDSCYATIVWPEEGGEVILKCTLTNEVKDCFKLIKTWKTTAVENFENYMTLIIVKKVQVLHVIWGKVIQELQTFNIENPEAVSIFVDKNKSVITVAGNKKEAEDLSTKIEEVTYQIWREK